MELVLKQISLPVAQILVLKQISLPVAQIRVICKNVPQVSMTNKMTFSQGKMEISYSS
jgi:hypothetical protein